MKTETKTITLAKARILALKQTKNMDKVWKKYWRKESKHSTI